MPRVPTKKNVTTPGRRVQFDEAGQGAYLLLRNSGVAALQGYYDTDHVNVVERAFLFYDMPVIERLLGLMVWQGEEKLEINLDDFGDDIPLSTIVDKIRDAWCLALNGRTYQQQVDYVREEARKLSEDPLLKSPEAGSERSDARPTERG